MYKKWWVVLWKIPIDEKVLPLEKAQEKYKNQDSSEKLTNLLNKGSGTLETIIVENIEDFFEELLWDKEKDFLNYLDKNPLLSGIKEKFLTIAKKKIKSF